MEDWYPEMIRASHLRGDHRICEMTDGSLLEERILLRDPVTRTFVYAIDKHPLPATGVVGSIRIDDDDGGSLVTWSAFFTADPALASEVEAQVAELYRQGLASLERASLALNS